MSKIIQIISVGSCGEMRVLMDTGEIWSCLGDGCSENSWAKIELPHELRILTTE